MSTQTQPPFPATRTNATSNTREFWKPQRPSPFRIDKCERCENELVVGSRFCHLCGAERDAAPQSRAAQWTELLDWSALRDRIGLSTSALVMLIVGAVCVVSAIFVGIRYVPATALEWQAVQTLRIEWLLAAGVAFLAGILLKRTN